MFGKARRLIRSFLGPLTLSVIGCLCAIQVSFAQRGGEGDMHISGRVQRHLNQAGECREKNDFDCARASLELIPRRGLNNRERSQYWNSLAYVEFLDGNFAGAAAAYRNVAELSGIPAGMRQASLRSVAQLHASMGQYQEAYEALEELLVLKGEIPLAGRHLTADGLWRGLDVYVIGTWDMVPLVPDPPVYPAEAVAQGLQDGYVVLEFTVTRTGSTRDVRVIESSAPLFERSAIEVAEKLKYKPRLVDGQPVEVAGVQHRIQFQSENLE
jgi:TonB family protein